MKKQNEYDKFNSFLGKVLKTPHSVIKAKLEAEKKAKKKSKRKK